MATVCATLSAVEVTERNFTITLTTSDDTGINKVVDIISTQYHTFVAVASFDYISVISPTTFASGSPDNATRCLNITIVDDDALEGDQTFISSLTTADPDVILGTTQTDITITDNDGQCMLAESHITMFNKIATCCICRCVSISPSHGEC